MTGLPHGNLIRHWRNTEIYYLTVGNHPKKTNETEQASSLVQFFLWQYVNTDTLTLQPIDQETRLGLLTLLEERYEKKSMIIVSQLKIDKWYDYLRDPTLADAIMDRIIGTSHQVHLTGDSMRKRKTKL
ncbi:MAG: ATP-binding protein [Prevotella sp.]|nr:ATP-binding protein [Prevotella sp.]MDD7127710.1 ATP-binding protein [Prevotella sp.]